MSSSYALFCALAGVRCGNGERPLIPPRGLPHDLSGAVSGHYFLPVIEHDRARGWGLLPTEFRTPEQALEQESRGALRLPETMTPPLVPATHGYIGARPDWHSATWLTLPELRQCLERAGLPLSATPVELRWLLRYLDVVEQTDNITTRLVLWFDN
jgi:hypothetical protein